MLSLKMAKGFMLISIHQCTNDSLLELHVDIDRTLKQISFYSSLGTIAVGTKSFRRKSVFLGQNRKMSQSFKLFEGGLKGFKSAQKSL